MAKWICNAKQNRPFRCLGDPLKANVPTCDITYFENNSIEAEKIVEAWETLKSLLPEWAMKKANLFLLADQELVLHEDIGSKVEVHIKKDRCTNCGDCCLETPDGHTPFGSSNEVCNALIKGD